MLGSIADPSLRHRAWLFTPSRREEEGGRKEGLRRLERKVREEAAYGEIDVGVFFRDVSVEGRWGPGVEEARARLLVFRMEIGRGGGGGGGGGGRKERRGQQQDNVVNKEEEKEEEEEDGEEEEEGEKIQRALVAWVGRVVRRAFSENEEEEGEGGREGGKQEAPPLSGLVLESLTFQQQQEGEEEAGKVWVVEDPYLKRKQ